MITFSDFRKSITFKLCVVAVFSYAMCVLSSFMFPLFLAVSLSFLLYPIAKRFEKLTVGKGGCIRISQGVAIFLSFLVFALFLGLLVAVIAPPLLNQLNELAAHLPEYAARAHIQDWQSILRDGNYPTLPSNLNSITDSMIGWTMGILGNMVRRLISSSMDIVANIVGLIVVPFLSFYLLKDWRKLCDMFVDLFNPGAQPKARQVLVHLGETLGGYVRGLGKLCMISGACVFAGTFLLGLDYSLVFGFVAILSETIPIFGPVFGAAAAIFTAYDGGVHLAVYVAIFYAVYYLFDANVLMPKIMGEIIDLPAVVLLVSLMIGGKLFGILGMLFAVPVAAVYRVLYKELWHEEEDKC